jgi:hypothetical protein
MNLMTKYYYYYYYYYYLNSAVINSYWIALNYEEVDDDDDDDQCHPIVLRRICQWVFSLCNILLIFVSYCSELTGCSIGRTV